MDDPAVPPVALLLPGQGAQYAAMAAGLYPGEPAFAEAIDAVFGALGAEGRRLRNDWLSDRPEVPLDASIRSQPLIFAVGHALGRLVLSWGVAPAALLGHSVGEFVAATLAGVFTVEDAARLTVERTRALAATAPGGMLAVSAAPERVAHVLGGDVVVGAVNAPRQTVLAGPDDGLDKAARTLADEGITCRRVAARTGFHSPMLAAAAVATAPLFAAVPTAPPRIPVWSAYTGGPLTPEHVADPLFWARGPAEPVLFRDALGALLATGDHLLVEVGPGQGLTQAARRHPAVRAGRSRVLPLLPARALGGEAERASVRRAEEALRHVASA
ncbi:acyltransferase domain-containing protein [Streptomyces radicis]|uniref:Acyltransferase domain-containing protein n=1 Tax=Streptomyces radicis TaxID=1750517 RepID=A0A3A9WG06_9ACTN|nr:acyltransferase domain-containing protein [Streptomyces radicis]RKN11552.1 acyltransferase domain-containing protein [Streptomyces radicis]RKN26430.1 acyltransferase domain-containing protein [Streptomyces radicis]